MILGEKSAAVTGGEYSPGQQKMPEADLYVFSDVVDNACKGLLDRQIKYSIRRIREMEDRICELEKELDNFLLSNTRL
jgi:DNA-dependent RNA polymerase auxiliary subunit epsilon